MKLIVALIRPEHRDAVLNSAHELEACVLSLSQVSDGGTPVVSGTYRGADFRTNRPRLRLEVVAEDTAVNELVDAIAFAAGGGASTQVGTCHVIVLPLEEWIQIPDFAQVQQSGHGKDQFPSHRPWGLDVTLSQRRS